MKLKFLLSIMLVTLMAFAQAQDLKTADQVLVKYFANTGGLDKWKALKSYTMTGRASQMGQEFPIVIYAKTPNKIKSVVSIQGMELIPQAFDGIDAWMVNPFSGSKDPVRLDDEMTKELKNEEFQDDFIDYKKKGHDVTLEGVEDIDGIKCYKILLIQNKNNPKDDVKETHYFDVENFVPICRVRSVTSGPQSGVEIRTYLSDYQEVNGLMFPFAIEQKANGETAVRMTFSKVTTNDITDDSIFAYPKKN